VPPVSPVRFWTCERVGFGKERDVVFISLGIPFKRFVREREIEIIGHAEMAAVDKNIGFEVQHLGVLAEGLLLRPTDEDVPAARRFRLVAKHSP